MRSLTPARRRMGVVAVVAALTGAAFGPAGVQAAKKAVAKVFVTNTAAHPVAVKPVGVTVVSGTVGVSGGTLGVSGKVDASGSKVDASGSAVSVTGPVGIAGAVHVAGETPFQRHGFWIFDPGDDGKFTVLTIPAGKQLVVQYFTAEVDAISSGADLPLQISVQDGHGTGGAAIYLPLQKSGSTWQGSEPTQVLLDQGAVDAYRPTTAGTARVLWELSGYLVDG